MSKLSIYENAILFGRLVLSDVSAIDDIVMRAKQNEASFIGVPNGVSTQMLFKLQDALEGSGIQADFVNFDLKPNIVNQAQKVVRANNRSADTERRQKTGVNKSGQFRDEGRRKAHKNARSLTEQKKRKQERADADRAVRAKMKSSSGKKND